MKKQNEETPTEEENTVVEQEDDIPDCELAIDIGVVADDYGYLF